MATDKSYNPTVFTEQNNFAAGELAPSMAGRSDTPLYQSGVSKMINWLVLPSGSIIRRPGTELIYAFGSKTKEEVKKIDLSAGLLLNRLESVIERAYGQKRLINLLYSRDLSLLLCLEQKNEITLLIRVLMQGQSLLQVLEIALPHPFELNDLTYSLAKGVMYLCFGIKHTVYTITIDDRAFQKMVAAVEEEIKQQQEYLGQRKKELDEFYSNFDMPLISRYFSKYHMSGEFREEGFRWDEKDFQQLSYYHAIEEAKKKYPNVLKELISFTALPATKISYEEAELNTLLKDFESATQLEEKLKASANKVKQEKVSGALIVPYNNRLWCFGSADNIHSVSASNKGDYGAFNTAYGSLLEVRNPLNALSGTFASDAFDAPLWAQALGNDLLIGTTDGIYTLNEGDRAKGEFIKIHKELDLALSPIAPVVLAKTLFFVEGGGKRLSCLYYSREKGGYQVHNLTAYADHLFSSGIIRIAAVATPFNMIFALLGNGQLAVLTYDSDLKLFGWSQQILGGCTTSGTMSLGSMTLDLCVVPTTNEDKLYLLVKRGNQTTIEVLKLSQISSLVQKGTYYLDGHTVLKEPEEIIADKVLEKLLTTREFWQERQGLPEGFYYLEGRIRSQIQLLLRFIQGGDFLLDGKAYRDLPETNAEEKRKKQDSLKNVDYIVRHIGISLVEQIGIYYKIYYLTCKLLNMIGERFYDSDPTVWQDLYNQILATIDDYRKIRETENWEIDFFTSGYSEFSCPALNINFKFTDSAFEPKEAWLHLIIEYGKKLVDFMVEFNKDNDRKRAIQMYEQWIATANASFIKKHLYGSTPNYQMISRWNKLAEEKDLWDLKPLEAMIASYVYGSHTFLQEQLPMLLQHFDFAAKETVPEQMTAFYQALLYDFKRSQEFTQYEQFTIWQAHWQNLLQSYLHQQKIELPPLQDKFIINMDASREDILRMAKICLGEEVSIHSIKSAEEEEKANLAEDNIVQDDLADLSNIEEVVNTYEEKIIPELPFPLIRTLYDADGQIFDPEELSTIKVAFQQILKEIELFLISKLKIITTEDQVFLEHLMQESQSLKFLRCLLFDRKNFLFSQDLIGLISPQDYHYLCAAMRPKQKIFYSDKLAFYQGQMVAMVGTVAHGNTVIGNIPVMINRITTEIEELANKLAEDQDLELDQKTKLQNKLHGQKKVLAQLKEQDALEQQGFLTTTKADTNLTIGYAYQSYLETFPLVFPQEQEGLLKKNATLSVKVSETKSLTVYAQQDNGQEVSYPIQSCHFESDDLRAFLSDKAYLVKEVAALVGRPYLNGWVDFNLQSPVKKDVTIKMIAEQPLAAAVLKIAVKAQLLPHYI